jgi:predicted lipoprotein
MKKISLLLFVLSVAGISSCNKDKDTGPDNNSLSNQEIQNSILHDFAHYVALSTYEELENRMNDFYSTCTAFDTALDQPSLDNARLAWKSVREVWEQSEAFLFGPVSTNNIDPSTDTWPVDYLALDSLMNTGIAFTQSFMNSLGDEMKGYHPSEYLLWGSGGNKLPSEFSVREREYLIALAADLQIKATSLRTAWDPAVHDNYLDHIVNAGQSTSVYPSQRSALEEMLNGMIGICDEVANGKMFEPFAGLDPSLEESPFSKNSLIDFRNNLKGVRNVYFGDFMLDGTGMNDFLSKNNASLNSNISNQINNAIISFDGITVPFGEAIISQRTQVQHVMDQINILKTTLETQALPFIQQTITE